MKKKNEQLQDDIMNYIYKKIQYIYIYIYLK